MKVIQQSELNPLIVAGASGSGANVGVTAAVSSSSGITTASTAGAVIPTQAPISTLSHTHTSSPDSVTTPSPSVTIAGKYSDAYQQSLCKLSCTLKLNLKFMLFPAATVVADLTPVATVTSTVPVSPVTVVTVSTVPSPVTAVQTVPLLPAALPHSVAQPTAAIPAFPPVMVPPFRVPLPGMHIPLPGELHDNCRNIITNYLINYVVHLLFRVL